MRGRVTVVRTYQDKTPPAKIDLHVAPDLETLHSIVGGWIELVPGFDWVREDGELVRCVAFCNEEGKIHNLRYNQQATLMWHDSLRLTHPFGGSYFDDYLAGDVAIVTGDDEFLASL
jgi:hypothetical protein